MIALLPLGLVILVIAVIYASIACAILWFLYNPSVSLWGAIGVATGGSAALNIVIFLLFHRYWESIWKRFPVLNRLLFPNLNGTWEMIIHWNSEDKNGEANAHAKITQNFLNIAMDVEAEDSDSYTLMAKPKRDPESGRPLLYYVYLTTPKATSKVKDHAQYTGAAILQLSLESASKLSGNYFTSKKTSGYFELNRKSSNSQVKNDAQ
mgnify:CR=1 FL=1